MAERKSKFRQNIETLSWIVAIICGLIVIWQAISPMFVKKPISQKADSIKAVATKPAVEKPYVGQKTPEETYVGQKTPEDNYVGEKTPETKKVSVKRPPLRPNDFGVAASEDRHLTYADKYHLGSMPDTMSFIIWNLSGTSEGNTYSNEISDFLKSKGASDITIKVGETEMDKKGDPRFNFIIHTVTKTVDIYVRKQAD